MDKKIVITGAAGLVGQNLIIKLKEKGYTNIVAIDKHPKNTEILKSLHKDIKVIKEDISKRGLWEKELKNSDILIILHAQIGAKTIEPFIRNNVIATKNLLDIAKKEELPYVIHASSSVLESVANDFYTNTKREQEKLVTNSGLNFLVLRPTLMYGWFDRKHLGWLARFMKYSPLFPIPGDGKFIRQPLYVMDFCNIIISAIENKKINEIYSITGKEQIYYIDMIRKIKEVTKAYSQIITLPYSLFWFLLKTAQIILKDPPFTTQQLKALVAGDMFEVIPWWDIFNVKYTTFEEGIKETFSHPVYSKIKLSF